MKPKQLSQILLLTSSVWLWCAMSATAQKVPKSEIQSQSIASVLRNSRPIREIRQLSEIEIPSTSAQMLVQSPAPSNPPSQGGSIVPITSVKANATDKGVEIILETLQGTQLQVTNRSTGNNFIADVSGGQLRLPSGEAFTFRSEKPLTGITEITVTNVDVNTVRVTVVGEKVLPTVELFDDNAGLVFGVTSAATATQPPQTPLAEENPASETRPEEPAAQQDQPIELVVTGEQDRYNVPDVTTATRTDTPLRDIPQSIQVVPRQVIEDRNARTLIQTVETVSGVVEAADNGAFAIRGFSPGQSGAGVFRNGFRDSSYNGVIPIDTIERVEVLKGPASVLFGSLEPGGIVNYVTRKPLSQPYYNLGFEVGNYGLYKPSIDLSGPLTADGKLLYRFIASYESSSDYQDFPETRETTIAPSLSLKLGERTDLNLYYEYNRRDDNPLRSYTAFLSDGSRTPRNLYLGYPNFNYFDNYAHRFGYTLNHKFNDNWQIRNNLSVSIAGYDAIGTNAGSIEDDRFADVDSYDTDYRTTNYFGQIDLLGKFNTGSIGHQLLVGFDYNRFVEDYFGVFNTTDLPPLDIRNPNYDVTKPENYIPFGQSEGLNQTYGVYLQDQIAFSGNLKLLIGGRYDWISSYSDTANFGVFTPGETRQNDGAFSPRIGLVYQPSGTVSLYASYSRSFTPVSGRNADGEPFIPTRGTQYEIGVRTDFLEGRLSANLAAYHLSKTNITTTDNFISETGPQAIVEQIGEQRSQGIELDVSGEILPGLNIVASYAYTDAEVTEDNEIPIGNRLNGIPENQASLWTTYFIQKGGLKGLGFGLGLFYVGDREGDLNNTFQLGDYLRTDAALYYRRDRLKAAINIRNLFDIDYTSFGYSKVSTDRGDPFTIVGSISWEL